MDQKIGNVKYVKNVISVGVVIVAKDRINIDPIDSTIKTDFKRYILDNNLGTYAKGLEHLLQKAQCVNSN